MDIRGFEAGCQFYDVKHFPVGFSRSGDFTLQQAELLQSYGHTLVEIESGEKKAKNREQKHFLSVCQGKKIAESSLERTWLKYKTITLGDHIVSAFGELKNQSVDANLSSEGKKTKH